jgi:hypothetical protein
MLAKMDEHAAEANRASAEELDLIGPRIWVHTDPYACRFTFGLHQVALQGDVDCGLTGLHLSGIRQFGSLRRRGRDRQHEKRNNPEPSLHGSVT